MHPTNCLNCAAALGIGQNFCSTCGQKAETHRISLHEIAHDAVHYVTHADKGIFHLIKELAIRPGVVAREYIAGKRVKYFKPVNFLLIVGAILVFTTTFFQKRTNGKMVQAIETQLAKTTDPAKRQVLQGKVEKAKKVEKLAKHTNTINMLATPLFAFIIWLFYLKDRYSLMEHLVANMYFITFTMLVYSLVVMPLQNLLAPGVPIWIFLMVFFLFEIVYRSLAYYHFINKRTTGQLLKALGVSFVTVTIWVVGSTWPSGCI